MKPIRNLTSLVLLGLLSVGEIPRVNAEGAPTNVGAVIASKHPAVFTKPPARIPSNAGTDAPLMGNGDFLAALGGSAENLQFHLSKADLWELRPDGGPRALARLDLKFNGMDGADYQVTQDLLHATTTDVFKKSAATLTVESAVAATENLLWVKLSAVGADITGVAGLHRKGHQDFPAAVADNEAAEGIQVAELKYDEGVNGVVRSTGAACALNILQSKGRSFTVSPGKPVILIVAASGLANTKDYRADAIRRATRTTAASLSTLRDSHDRWWRDFWGKSFVEIPDKLLESRYYLSHYALACASRLPHFPPGLYGWTLSEETPMWGGAYFNNYNFHSTFYSLYAANHIEQAMPGCDAVIAATGLGRDVARAEARYDTMCANSEKLANHPGILLPVSMLPHGVIGAPTTWGQRSNGSYACVQLASTWYATYDLEFAKRAYPFVLETATFWEHFLVFENGRYVIKNDAVLENSGRDTNPIVSLALIRKVMNLSLDMSAAMGLDANRHAKWRDIRDRLSDYPICTVGDLPQGSRIALPDTPETRALPIFRYSESGTAWQNDNAVGIQHIFPGNSIGLGIRPDLLDRARNQIRVMARWIDLNGCNSFYPAAVRVGYDPDEILRRLRQWVETSDRNGMRADNPHGVELFSVVPTTLQEMLFQSYDGVLRFFPNWPVNQDARFGTLRAVGAFLVSAELKGGIISGVKITSEKGGDCAIVNPWPGRNVQVIRNGNAAETAMGPRFTLKTAVDEIIELR